MAGLSLRPEGLPQKLVFVHGSMSFVGTSLASGERMEVKRVRCGPLLCCWPGVRMRGFVRFPVTVPLFWVMLRSNLESSRTGVAHTFSDGISDCIASAKDAQ